MSEVDGRATERGAEREGTNAKDISQGKDGRHQPHTDALY